MSVSQVKSIARSVVVSSFLACAHKSKLLCRGVRFGLFGMCLPLGVCVAGFSGPALAQAQAPTPALPSPSQAQANPLAFGAALMDVTVRAEEALEKKNYPIAIQLFEELAKVVPNRAVAHSKLCMLYATVGQRERGLASCRKAVSLPGAQAGDLARLGKLLLGPAGTPLSANQVSDIEVIIQRLDKIEELQITAATLACDLALRLEQDLRLRGCVNRMEMLVPKGDTRVIAYRFSYRAYRGDFDLAQVQVQKAQDAGFPPESIALMKRKLEALRNAGSSDFSIWTGLAALILVFGGLLAAKFLNNGTSRATGSAVE